MKTIKTFKDLEKLDILQLKKLWQIYFYEECDYTRQSIVKPLWYKMQCKNQKLKIEQKHITKLNRYAKDPEGSIDKSKKITYKLKPGLEIIKTYKGKTHIVKVISPNEFLYKDKIYSTISATAVAIYGNNVSGYEFFGLNNKNLKRQES